MSAATHTPTPWALPAGVMGADTVWDDTGRIRVASFVNEYDAQFIVTACNAHDALVARVAELTHALKAIAYGENDPAGIARRALQVR